MSQWRQFPITKKEFLVKVFFYLLHGWTCNFKPCSDRNAGAQKYLVNCVSLWGDWNFHLKDKNKTWKLSFLTSLIYRFFFNLPAFSGLACKLKMLRMLCWVMHTNATIDLFNLVWKTQCHILCLRDPPISHSLKFFIFLNTHDRDNLFLSFLQSLLAKYFGSNSVDKTKKIELATNQL